LKLKVNNLQILFISKKHMIKYVKVNKRYLQIASLRLSLNLIDTL